MGRQAPAGLLGIHLNLLLAGLGGGYPSDDPSKEEQASLSYFNEVGKGGHFAAWEEPELFATEIRAAFRPLR